jgi:hypothetical protein
MLKTNRTSTNSSTICSPATTICNSSAPTPLTAVPTAVPATVVQRTTAIMEEEDTPLELLMEYKLHIAGALFLLLTAVLIAKKF